MVVPKKNISTAKGLIDEAERMIRDHSVDEYSSAPSKRCAKSGAVQRDEAVPSSCVIEWVPSVIRISIEHVRGKGRTE